MTSTATTAPAPTVESLLPLIGYFRSDEEAAAAGFVFEATTPDLGETVALYSRGGYRRAIVTHVTRTGTVSAVYVTEGGVNEAQRIAAGFAAMDTAAQVDASEKQDRKNYRWSQAMAAGTADIYARFPGQYTADRKAEEMARYQVDVDAVEAQGGLEAVLSSKRAARIAAWEATKATPWTQRVTITTGKAKAAQVGRQVF